MQRKVSSIALVGLALFVGSSLPAASQDLLAAANASTPASCFSHPAGLDAGNYPWDAPACDNARKHWELVRSAQHRSASTQASTVEMAAADTAAIAQSASPTLLPVGSAVADRKGLAFVTAGLAEPPPNAQNVWLPKGTLFPVHTMQSYSTFEALPYGKLRFELDEDVVVNGFLVAMKGDTAEGSFPNAMTGRNFFFFKISGSLFQISVDTIYNYCGDKIDVNFDRTEYRSARLGPFNADMDQHIIRGQQYVSFTSHPQRVCAVRTAEGNSDISSSSLYPTTH